MINVTGATFIRNAFDGGFPIFESLIPVMAVTDTTIVIDMGSTDGTLQVLDQIAHKNPRLKVYRDTWTKLNDPSAFADIANRCVESAQTKAVYFWQADEVLTNVLVKEIRELYSNNIFDMTFERIQLSHGFQQVKWLPHVVCRSLTKGSRTFVKDGMSVGDTGGCIHMCPYPVVPGHPLSGKPNTGRAFPWHQPKPGLQFDSKHPRDLNAQMAEVFPWDHFLIDTSSCFRDNQAGKKTLHSGFWNESDKLIDGVQRDEWIRRAHVDPAWTRKICPFPLPLVLHGLVGMPKYELRPEVRESLENNDYGRWGL